MLQDETLEKTLLAAFLENLKTTFSDISKNDQLTLLYDFNAIIATNHEILGGVTGGSGLLIQIEMVSDCLQSAAPN